MREGTTKRRKTRWRVVNLAQQEALSDIVPLIRNLYSITTIVSFHSGWSGTLWQGERAMRHRRDVIRDTIVKLERERATLSANDEPKVQRLFQRARKAGIDNERNPLLQRAFYKLNRVGEKKRRLTTAIEALRSIREL